MRAVLAIAPEVLAGEIAARPSEFDAAVAHLERAVRLEDGLVYTEPAEWHYPPRHALGAVLLAAGRPAEAETVYWEDLSATARTAGRSSAWCRRCGRRARRRRRTSSRGGRAAASHRADFRPSASRISATTTVVNASADADGGR